MIDRKHIESFLKLNGVPPSAPDEEIKSLLISARWHEKDVETALVVLREDPDTRHQHIDTVHKIFNTDERIEPETLNSLLGINVELSKVSSEHHHVLERAYRAQVVSMVVVSIILATLLLVSIMWFLKAGVFHTEW